MREAVRMTHNPKTISVYGHHANDERIAFMDDTGHPQWTGIVRCLPERLEHPFKRKKPTKFFVNSMSDLFHEKVPIEFIDMIFAVMATNPHHTFQILTKRPEIMRKYLSMADTRDRVRTRIVNFMDLPWEKKRTETQIQDFQRSFRFGFEWPLQNVWLGVSAEDQKTADERIPVLLETPAAIRWVSLEPLLDDVYIREYFWNWDCPGDIPEHISGLDWVVVGGESGHNARPMNPEWVRRVREQCRAQEVPIFFKQWGAWWGAPIEDSWGKYNHIPEEKKTLWSSGDTSIKKDQYEKDAYLDGEMYREFPVVR